MILLGAIVVVLLLASSSSGASSTAPVSNRGAAAGVAVPKVGGAGPKEGETRLNGYVVERYQGGVWVFVGTVTSELRAK